MLKIHVQNGVTLLELSISMVLVALISLSLVQLYPIFFKQMLMIHRRYYLQLVLQQTLFTISKDLRRAGFAFYPTEDEVINIQSTADYSCIIIGYDFNRSGYIETTGTDADLFAWRWQDNKLSHARSKQCNDSGWEQVLDPAEFIVTQFEVKLNQSAVNKYYFTVILAAYYRYQPQIKEQLYTIIPAENI